MFVCLEASTPQGLSLFIAFVWNAVKGKKAESPADSLTYVYGVCSRCTKSISPLSQAGGVVTSNNLGKGWSHLCIRKMGQGWK